MAKASDSTPVLTTHRLGANSPILFVRGTPIPSRAEIEAMVEGLIAYLDGLDGDADLEQEEPEASAREWCGSGAHRYDVGAEA